MHMQVQHFLAAFAAIVHDNPESAFRLRTATLLPRQSRRQKQHSTKERFMARMGVAKRRKMLER